MNNDRFQSKYYLILHEDGSICFARGKYTIMQIKKNFLGIDIHDDGCDTTEILKYDRKKDESIGPSCFYKIGEHGVGNNKYFERVIDTAKKRGNCISGYGDEAVGSVVFMSFPRRNPLSKQELINLLRYFEDNEQTRAALSFVKSLE